MGFGYWYIWFLVFGFWFLEKVEGLDRGLLLI